MGNKKILVGVGTINIVNGCLLSLTPIILKNYTNYSLWFIGIYLSLNTIVTSFGSSSYFFNRIIPKWSFNKLTSIYLTLPIVFMTLIVLLNAYYLIPLFFVVFAFLQICRNISLVNITMLAKDNIELVEKRDQVATITSIGGLLVGQYLLNININVFLFFLLLCTLVGDSYLFFNKEEIEHKSFTTTTVKQKDFDKFGFLLGLDKGMSLIIITILNYLVVVNINNYGYFKVSQAILSLFVIGLLTSIVKRKKENINKIINLRTILLMVPIITILVSYYVDISNIYLLVLLIFTLCLSESGGGVFLNFLFNKIDHKNVAKHTILFSSYNKTCTIFLIISILIIKYMDFTNLIFVLTLVFACFIVLLLSNYVLKKELLRLEK